MSRKLNYIILLLTVASITSCKLFKEKDTIDPIVSLSIDGGNEISRGVTLYLDIEDDSKIDFVSIIIDDTTAITVESNFDTIRFDVTPFADESEHQLYAKVADIEGNIGESEKLDVVITEYPGWRIYNDYIFNGYFVPIIIDQNGIVLIGTGWGVDGFYIFDPSENEWQQFTQNNSPLLSGSVNDIGFIEDGRIWIANYNSLTEYLYGLNHWGRTIILPNNQRNGENEEISSIAIDKNYDVWIGTYWGGIYHYSGDLLVKNYLPPEIPEVDIHDLVIGNNNTLYAATEGTGVFSIKDGIVTTYPFFNDNFQELITVAIDSSSNVYASQGDGGFVFDGNNWKNIEQPSFTVRYFPILFTSANILYTQGMSSGLVSWDGTDWTEYKNFDTPFKNSSVENKIGLPYRSLAEAPNGDIWMVAGGKLMRYRPSLGGYP